MIKKTWMMQCIPPRLRSMYPNTHPQFIDDLIDEAILFRRES
jgi:hypothetical protein